MNSTNQESPFPTSDSMSGSTRSQEQGSSSTASGSSAEGGGSSANGPEGSRTPRGADVVDRLAQGAHKAVDRMAEKAAPAVERVSSTIEGARARAHSQADRVSGLQDEWVSSARECVRNHPIASVGIAVVAGMLLSRILNDR